MTDILRVPKFYVKLLTLSGTVIGTTPLEIADVEYTDQIYVVGQRSNIGSFTIKLKSRRDPRYAFLASTYNSIDYEQRVEIYEHPDCLTNPVFCGVVTNLPSDLNQEAFSGVGILRRLDTRKLRKYHTIGSGTALAAITQLLKTYDSAFNDDFNRASIGSDWTTVGSVAIVSNVVKLTSNGASISYASTWTAGQWSDTKVSFDFALHAEGYISIELDKVDGVTDHYGRLNIAMGSNYAGYSTDATFILYQQDLGVSTSIATRQYVMLADTIYHLDIYTKIEGSTRRWIVVLNGVEILNIVDSRSNTDHAGSFGFIATASPTTPSDQFDNFIFAPAIQTISINSVPTGTTFTQTFFGDSQLAAIEWIMDHEGWEYWIDYRSGATSDLFSAGTSAGTDYSASVILEEGKNISELKKTRVNEDLATSLFVIGISRDDANANFISNQLSAIATYGIIEKDYNDDRINDVTIAKLLGDNRVAIVSGGKISLQGKAVYNSPTSYKAGDQVYLKAPSLNIDKSVRIVSMTRRSGDPVVDLIFDYFPYRRSEGFRQLQSDYYRLQRAFIQRMNAQNVRLNLVGTTAQTWTIFLRGQVVAVYFDITSSAWAGAVTVTIDGTDRTNAIFGSATLTADAHANDTTYLVPSGNHTIVFTPTATVTLDIKLDTQVIS